jgi:hypothetical protein
MFLLSQTVQCLVLPLPVFIGALPQLGNFLASEALTRTLLSSEFGLAGFKRV